MSHLIGYEPLLQEVLTVTYNSVLFSYDGFSHLHLILYAGLPTFLNNAMLLRPFVMTDQMRLSVL